MILLRIQTFIKSLIFHINNGLPKTSKEDIQIRYNICLKCPHFNNKKSQCNLCGCSISSKSKFLNKLAWADQSCPDNRWEQIFYSRKNNHAN
jgi:hypothetical protein